MIEINLVPDIKQELIRAERVRATVISMAIIASIAAVGIVIALCLWVFGAQLILGASYDKTINEKAAEISKIDDLSNALTIQNQLNKLPLLNSNKNISSRLFSVLETVNPPAPNDVRVTTASVDSEAKLISIEAQASGGFSALETFRKTIEATQIKFSLAGESKTAVLATELSDTDRSFGEDVAGNQVLRFKLSFTYADDLFSPEAKNLTIVAPTKTNVTDSFLGVPPSLFTTKAGDISKEKQ